jgi:hypothetical protein
MFFKYFNYFQTLNNFRSVSFTNKHVNHTVIFELKKLYKKNKKNKNIYTIMALYLTGRKPQPKGLN